MTAWTVLATCGPAAIVALLWLRRTHAEFTLAARIAAQRDDGDAEFWRIVAHLDPDTTSQEDPTW